MTPRAAIPALALALLVACAPPPGALGPAPDAPVLAAAVPGQALPFGEVATACGTAGDALGPAIAAEAGYAVHDTAPDTVAPRTHYVTGFSDGCPRQVTAALVLFGDLATHETMRYLSVDAPYSPTDAAYEALKAGRCGAAPGEPCGAGLDGLAADTVFLTLYPAFGAEEGADLLLSGGAVLASDL